MQQADLVELHAGRWQYEQSAFVNEGYGERLSEGSVQSSTNPVSGFETSGCLHSTLPVSEKSITIFQKRQERKDRRGNWQSTPAKLGQF